MKSTSPWTETLATLPVPAIPTPTPSKSPSFRPNWPRMPLNECSECWRRPHRAVPQRAVLPMLVEMRARLSQVRRLLEVVAVVRQSSPAGVPVIASVVIPPPHPARTLPNFCESRMRLCRERWPVPVLEKEGVEIVRNRMSSHLPRPGRSIQQSKMPGSWPRPRPS